MAKDDQIQNHLKELPYPVEKTYLETNSLRLHAVQAGPEDGPLVILLHGFPEFWYGWVKQIEPLALAGFRVLAVDQRGYNLSDKPQGLDAYRLDQPARDVIGLIDLLERETAFLVGHDWGGVVAWVVAALFPERVAKMAVLNAPYPTTGFRAIFRDPTQLLRSAYIIFFQLPGLPEAILRKDDWDLLVRGMRNTSRPGTFSEEDFEQYRQAWWRKDAMTSMLNWYRAFLRRPAQLPWKPRISVPTLVLWGARDIALSRATARLSLELLEEGQLEFFENATHWLQHERASSVNALLIDFLQG